MDEQEKVEKMKPDYNHAEEFTSAGAVTDFIKAHYTKYTVRSFPGEQSFGWFGAGNELGFYCSIKGKGYAFYPKEEGK